MRQVQFPDILPLIDICHLIHNGNGSSTSIANASLKDWVVGFPSLEANLDTSRKELLSVTRQCRVIQTMTSYLLMGNEEIRQPQ